MRNFRFQQVSHLFRHPTTESIIKIVIVEIIIFQDNEVSIMHFLCAMINHKLNFTVKFVS